MMFSYELNVCKDGNDIVLSQIVGDETNRITISSAMVQPLCKELMELNNLEIQFTEKEEKKESSAKERKEEISFDDMKTV